MPQPDYLTRQLYIDLLKSIIANQKDNSTGYSFAIDGEWGSGKTWILQELEKQLLEEKDNKYLIFHYNAWENDFYDEPLVAILSVMIEKLNKVTSQKSIYEAAINELLRQTSTDLLTLVSGIVKEVTKIDAEEIIKRKKGFFSRIKENTKLSAKDINTLVPLQHTLQEVRNNLKRLSEKYHIIIIVDELDRCLPEYAIKVLERLHHICNEMPLIRILAINKRNLADSIAKVFGKNFERIGNLNSWNGHFAELYLQKFVEVIIPLSNGKLDKKLEILNGLEKKYKSYIRNYNDGKEFIKLDDDFLGYFITTLMDDVERRVQEKIFSLVALCHKLTLQTGIKYEEDQNTYAILIYEIVSCICRYIFHFKDTCHLRFDSLQHQFSIMFYDQYDPAREPEKIDNKKLNENLCKIFNHNENNARSEKDFEIIDTKTYLMAFYTATKRLPYSTFEEAFWEWIAEDKKFLQKFDELMNILVP